MLAGLVMTHFRGGFKAKDLEPNTGKDSMTRGYKLFEYAHPILLIKWEDHSESRPLLLTNDSEERRLAKPRYSRSVVFLSLMPVLSLNKVAKSLASRTSQADLQPPKVAFICVLAP